MRKEDKFSLFHQTASGDARAARGEFEDALGPDVRHWPWSRFASLWLDALLVLEEHAA
jgi:hypothetical protein